jgi:predicted ATPase/DNA-binding CsgD family transcriptional regulator
MVGREKEISDLISLLRKPDVGLITLHGFGGTGKTRLAVEVGRVALEMFPDGVWFVALAPLSSPEHIITATAAAMEYSFAGAEDQKSQLIQFLRDKKLLLIFDNLEHLLPEGSTDIEELLQNATEAKLLVTSRQPLNVVWEWVYPLHGLAYEAGVSLTEDEIPAAAQLFLQHLNRAGSRSVDNDAACATQICQMVNGLPLALLLAASWGRTLGCREIIQEIQNNIGFLQSHQKTFPEKHSSMQAVFDYSWQLLSDQERAVLRKLTVFRGGFDRNAAAEVAGADLAILAALVDHSLIERVSQDRYQIHELLRQYLQGRLIEAGEQTLTHDLHLTYYTHLAEQAEPELRGKHEQAWLKRLRIEIDNIRAALDRCLADGSPANVEKGLRLMASLERFWLSHSYLSEGYTYLVQLLEKRSEEVSSAYAYAQARGLNLAAMLSFSLEENSATRRFAGEALQVGLELNEPQLIGDAYFYQGIDACERRESATARVALERALENYNKCGDMHGTAQALRGLGRNEFFERNFSDAFHHLSTALELARKQEDARNIYSTMRLLGELGTEYPPIGLDQAQNYFEQALKYASEVDDKPFIVYLLNGMGEIARLEGNFEQAARLFEQIDSMLTEMSNKESVIVTQLNLAFMYARLGNHDRSKQLLMKNLLPSLSSEQHSGPMCLLGLIGIAAAEGKAQLGAKILGALDPYKADFLFYKTDRNDYEHFVASVKAQLSEKQFNQLYEEGKGLSLEDAAQLIQSQGIKEKSRSDERLNQLTKREIEILRLVAQGLMDAQVAERLVLSPRTVNAHLTSIYNKLGVNSRSAATRYAIEHGLS